MYFVWLLFIFYLIQMTNMVNIYTFVFVISNLYTCKMIKTIQIFYMFKKIHSVLNMNTKINRSTCLITTKLKIHININNKMYSTGYFIRVEHQAYLPYSPGQLAGHLEPNPSRDPGPHPRLRSFWKHAKCSAPWNMKHRRKKIRQSILNVANVINQRNGKKA